jgi:dTDP-4-dehydrorhamnose 3,5-epimerase
MNRDATPLAAETGLAVVEHAGQPLPAGVAVLALPSHRDARGSVTELHRRDWGLPRAPVQWNVGRSLPGTLRGVHVHPEHTDYLIVLAGRMHLGLYDLREESPTRGTRAMLVLDPLPERSVRIPPGVAHGVCFPDGGLHAYGLSSEWRPEAVIACRWDDAELGLAWPVAEPLLSERDRCAGSLGEARAEFARRRHPSSWLAR